jgi:hypothetical protein
MASVLLMKTFLLLLPLSLEPQTFRFRQGSIGVMSVQNRRILEIR